MPASQRTLAPFFALALLQKARLGCASNNRFKPARPEVPESTYAEYLFATAARKPAEIRYPDTPKIGTQFRQIARGLTS
jgi:hypothetical protein